MNIEPKQAAASLLAAHTDKRSPTRFARDWGIDGLADAYAVASEAIVENMLAKDAEDGIAAFLGR